MLTDAEGRPLIAWTASWMLIADAEEATIYAVVTHVDLEQVDVKLVTSSLEVAVGWFNAQDEIDWKALFDAAGT